MSFVTDPLSIYVVHSLLLISVVSLSEIDMSLVFCVHCISHCLLGVQLLGSHYDGQLYQDMNDMDDDPIMVMWRHLWHMLAGYIMMSIIKYSNKFTSLSLNNPCLNK